MPLELSLGLTRSNSRPSIRLAGPSVIAPSCSGLPKRNTQSLGIVSTFCKTGATFRSITIHDYKGAYLNSPDPFDPKHESCAIALTSPKITRTESVTSNMTKLLLKLVDLLHSQPRNKHSYDTRRHGNTFHVASRSTRQKLCIKR